MAALRLEPSAAEDPGVTPARTSARRCALLLAAALALAGSAPAAAVTTGPGWTVEGGAGTVQSATGTPDGRELLLWSTGAAARPVTGGGQLVLHARADLCDGPPQAEVMVDGAAVGRLDVVNATQWWDYPVGPALSDATHTVQVRFLNDAMRAGCDRNLHVGWVSTTGVAAAPTAVAGNPFTAGRPYVDPTYPSVQAAAQRRSYDPTGAAALDRISAQTAALWVGDWFSTGAVDDAVRSYTARANAAGQTAVVAVYAIPGRDCGSYSTGGLTPDTYPGGWPRWPTGCVAPAPRWCWSPTPSPSRAPAPRRVTAPACCARRRTP